MEMKFFRAGRGEGKTKWLLEQAIGAREAGYDVWYVGNKKTMEHLSDMWRSAFHELCPIKHIERWHYSPQNGIYCFLTDNFLENVEMIGFWKGVINQKDGVWYITMDKEYFVN